MSCLLVTPRLTATCSIFPPGQSHLPLAASTTRRDSTRDRDALNTTFNSIGSIDGQSYRVNRDIWGVYEEVRVPFTSPTWNFPGFYSFEVDFAEREEWYSNNTSDGAAFCTLPGQPAAHTRYNAQKPKVSVRWQPLDPKYIGAVTLRGSYTEAFHAPTLSELTPAGTQNFPIVADPFSKQTEPQIEERILGNPDPASGSGL